MPLFTALSLTVNFGSKAKNLPHLYLYPYTPSLLTSQSGATINSRIPVDELRVQVVQQIKVLALKRRTDKFLFLYSKIGKAVLKIQTAARTFIAKKAYLLKHSHSMQTEVGWLVDVLKLGIRVTKVAYNGGVPRARFLWLEGDSFSLGSARICVSSKLAKGNAKTKGIYIADIAEIRPSSSSYTFKLSGSKFDDSECLSIIGTERTVDLVVRAVSFEVLSSLQFKFDSPTTTPPSTAHLLALTPSKFYSFTRGRCTASHATGSSGRSTF